ncbi:hypothetical protein Tco_1454631 [Tanacetum coccineum]
MSMSVQNSQVHKMAKRLCLVDDLKMLKITMSNTSSRNKLNPEVNDHYNIFSKESQEYELKTKDEALTSCHSHDVTACASLLSESNAKIPIPLCFLNLHVALMLG